MRPGGVARILEQPHRHLGRLGPATLVEERPGKDRKDVDPPEVLIALDAVVERRREVPVGGRVIVPCRSERPDVVERP
jgi:hypothetical protein